MENEEIIVKEEIEDILPDNFETASTSSSAAHLKRSASHLLDDSPMTVQHYNNLMNAMQRLTAEVQAVRDEIWQLKAATNVQLPQPEIAYSVEPSFPLNSPALPSFPLNSPEDVLNFEVDLHHNDNMKHAFKPQPEIEFSVLPSFPLNSPEDVQNFEADLHNNDNIKIAFKQFIMQVVGEEFNKYLRIVLRKIFKDETLVCFSWRGTATKPGMKNLLIVKIIKDYSLYKYSNMMEKHACGVIQQHIVHAMDRIKKRQMRKFN